MAGIGGRERAADELRRIAFYGTCTTPGCHGALDTRLVDLGAGGMLLERFCPDCSQVQ